MSSSEAQKEKKERKEKKEKKEKKRDKSKKKHRRDKSPMDGDDDPELNDDGVSPAVQVRATISDANKADIKPKKKIDFGDTTLVKDPPMGNNKKKKSKSKEKRKKSPKKDKKGDNNYQTEVKLDSPRPSVKDQMKVPLHGNSSEDPADSLPELMRDPNFQKLIEDYALLTPDMIAMYYIQCNRDF